MQFLTKLYYFCLTSHACAWYINLIWFHFISLDSIFIYFVFRFASLILRISNRFSFQLTHTNGTQTHANWIPCGGIGCEFSATQLQLPGNCIRTGRAKKNRTGKWPTAEPLTQKKVEARKTIAERSTLKPSLSLETLPGAARLISKPQTGLQLWLAKLFCTWTGSALDYAS